MKFDCIIIGGGLCGLTAGIRLAENGKKTAIVSSGQSALHFCAGSFGLLGKQGGKFVDNPLCEIKNLADNHPYRLMGAGHVAQLAGYVPGLLKKAGISTSGSADANHYTLTPFGLYRPSWLTLHGYPTFDNATEKPFGKALIISLKGFLESYPAFLAENLEKQGVKCRIEILDLQRLEHLRESNFDMRAVSVAKQMDPDTIEEFASKINTCASQDETVLIPAILGINNEEHINRLRSLVNNTVFCIPTIPVSVSGLRTQHMLQHYFEKLGGTYLLGDHVDKGVLNNGKVSELITTNFGEDHLEADTYILASGSLFSAGVIATPKGFHEPVFGLDLHYPENRDKWYAPNFFDAQPYMNYGIEVDGDFHPFINGQPVVNLYAAGAVLANCDSLAEDSGAGTAILTGLHVASLAMNDDLH